MHGRHWCMHNTFWAWRPSDYAMNYHPWYHHFSCNAWPSCCKTLGFVMHPATQDITNVFNWHTSQIWLALCCLRYSGLQHGFGVCVRCRPCISSPHRCAGQKEQQLVTKSDQRNVHLVDHFTLCDNLFRPSFSGAWGPPRPWSQYVNWNKHPVPVPPSSRRINMNFSAHAQPVVGKFVYL